MANISEIMSKNYDGIRFYPFNQNMFSWGRDKGVCNALSRVWLKTQPTDRWEVARLGADLDKVRRKQEKYENDEKSIKSIKVVSSFFRNNFESSADFYEACADAMVPLTTLTLLQVGITAPSGNHSVAVSLGPNEVELLFDPNGGVIETDSGELETWIKEHFFQADEYKDAYKIQVRHYTSKLDRV